jgi:Ca-activated chloride channel family protein
MQRFLAALAIGVLVTGSAQARGILIPQDKNVPPLAMLNHHVTINIDDQVAVTRVEQTFRNHTSRQLEATYVFPVPKGASVRKFSMWVNGKEVPGELVEADKARQIYTSIVQRTLDPGLLEYMGNNLLRLKVFPVPANGDQKIALSFTSVVPSDNGLIEYVYPLKSDGKAVNTLEKFSVKLELKSQHPIQNVYSPSHAITMTRPNDRQAVIGFEKDQAALERDFQLFYTAGAKDVGLTALTHRPSASSPGHFMLLVSPRAELSKEQQVPRDMVLVLDTSGSMRGPRMTQARNALKYCLSNLQKQDRFTVINFATTVNRYTEKLLPATRDEVEQARKWVDNLEATGGTAINDALMSALDLRTDEEGRTFTIVFFTDGRPTIGETSVERIQKNVSAKNTASTRIFTFGVGDDLNASFLDQLAEQSRAVSTYVREFEDIESKVSRLYDKISNPVLTNLRLEVSPNVKLSEVYPPQLPDLFHGSQLVVLGRYNGEGKATLKLTGQVGKETREFVYDASFAGKTVEDKPFVEDLWARRKVGYLLDQIRLNGEKKELVDEVVTLAKRHGITTPYTSYLIVPDGPKPVAQNGAMPGAPPVAAPLPAGLFRPRGGRPLKVEEFARETRGAGGAGGLADSRARRADKDLKQAAEAPASPEAAAQTKNAIAKKRAFDEARQLFLRRDREGVQGGKLGVDLSEQTSGLRTQTRLTRTASRTVNGRSCLEIGGVWIDEGFTTSLKTAKVKAMSAAYFRILERQPRMREVFGLGNYVVWVTPSGAALILDLNDGRAEMSDVEIDQLFVAAKK